MAVFQLPELVSGGRHPRIGQQFIRRGKPGEVTDLGQDHSAHAEANAQDRLFFEPLLLKRVGLPSIRFHDLRHTFATHALASGVDVKTLSSILGHTRAAFTLDTYTHTTGDMQRRASEVIGDFLTDIFGEELRPWEESAKVAKAQSV